MSEGKKNSLIPFFESRDGLTEAASVSDVKRAIEKFRHNSSAVPVERLYTAYRSLKEIIDSMGPEFAHQSSHFNDLFLRILEERGESGGGIYRSVLRDSSEFRLLSGMLIRENKPEPVVEEEPAEEDELPEEPLVKLTLKGIVSDKKISLESCLEDDWNVLVDEYFTDFTEEKILVKNCSNVINRIVKRGDYLDYHIVRIIEYLFGRLKSYNKIDISSKDYAMKLINMQSGKGETWKKLHEDYREIIRK